MHRKFGLTPNLGIQKSPFAYWHTLNQVLVKNCDTEFPIAIPLFCERDIAYVVILGLRLRNGKLCNLLGAIIYFYTEYILFVY